MKAFIDSYKKTRMLHHACLFEGERKIILPLITNFFEKEVGVNIHSNPDFHIREYDTFGIEDGKNIQNLALQKAFSGNKKIFVISFNTITREAQNALLKLFEEPTPHTHFFLIAKISDLLLPTLRSRLMIINSYEAKGNEKEIEEDAKTFLSSKKPDRLNILKPMIEEKDKTHIVKFLNAIETLIYNNVDYRKDKRFIDALRYIEKNKRYVYDKSASLKMLLEHIALVIPQLKF